MYSLLGKKNSKDLNFDILTKIFEQFFLCSQTEDIKIAHSLFTCALVNKQWCESALPLLWRDPFQFIGEDSSSNDKAGELVITLLSCLTKEECGRLFLNMKGHIPKLINLPPIFRRRPYFNYPDYIKDLHTKGLINSALNWFKNYCQFINTSGPNSSNVNSNSTVTLNRINSNISLKRSNSSLSINNDASNFDNYSDRYEKKIFVEQIIECLLQMFVDRNIIFKNVSVKKVRENDFIGCLFKSQFVNAFKQIQKLDILEMRIPEYSDMLNVWKDFANLTSLSITIQNSNYSNLSQILQSTKKNLRKLKINSGETKYILPLLSPKYSSSIQHLIFDNVQFDTSDPWDLLSNFSQLRKMKLIQCWINPNIDKIVQCWLNPNIAADDSKQKDSKQKMFSIITQMQFSHLKLFVCATSEAGGLSIEDDSKSDLVHWGVQQHAVVALENLGLEENVRIYHESMMGGLQVDAVKHHRYTSYMNDIKKSLKAKS